MGNIRLYGSTSGYTELAPPAVAPDGVLALPSGTGTLATQAYVDTAGGMVLQVVAASTSTAVSTNSTTFVDTTLTATITPSSTSSKVLVLVAQAGCGKDTNDTTLGLRLLRNSTPIAVFEASGGWTAAGGRNFIGTCAVNWLDAPSTTSAVTYKTQQNSFNGGANSITQYNVGAGHPSSTIILLEIK